MSERTTWAVAGVAFHAWLALLFVDASDSRLWATFAMAAAWAIMAVFKTLHRMGVFE